MTQGRQDIQMLQCARWELVVSGSELENAAKDAVIAKEILEVTYIKLWKVMTK